MSEKKKKCPTCGNQDELCEKCERAQLVEAKRLEMEQRAEGPEGKIDPKAKLEQLSEQWDKSRGKGRIATRVLPPPTKQPRSKKQTKKHTRVIPLPKKAKKPPMAEDKPNESCLVEDCSEERAKTKKGFCNSCFSLGAHWSIRKGDLKSMSIIPSDAQLKAFREHFNT